MHFIFKAQIAQISSLQSILFYFCEICHGSTTLQVLLLRMSLRRVCCELEIKRCSSRIDRCHFWFLSNNCLSSKTDIHDLTTVFRPTKSSAAIAACFESAVTTLYYELSWFGWIHVFELPWKSCIERRVGRRFRTPIFNARNVIDRQAGNLSSLRGTCEQIYYWWVIWRTVLVGSCLELDELD